MYVGVSGNLGSGKTTIARGLAHAFSCPLYPTKSYDTSYVRDLFRYPERWTTEAQISFMVHKHDAIRQGMESDQLFIVDRTFGEDVQVFAERFYDDGNIDDRGIQLIRQLSSRLESRLERPSLIVFCDCPVELCNKRLAQRQREYQKHYPSDHLAKLDLRLRDWLSQQNDIPIITLNTEKRDFRNSEEIWHVAREIDNHLSGAPQEQLNLFWSERVRPSSGKLLPKSTQSLLRAKQVYLAAPFTARSKKTQTDSGDKTKLFSDPAYIENIPRYYRRQLLDVAKALEAHGYDVFLPHRDINQWGKCQLSSDDIAKQCLDAVAQADCFIGLISESMGSHVELGYALGLGKPTVIMRSDSNSTSFFGLGVSSMKGVGAIRAPSIPKLIERLRKEDPLAWTMTGGT